MSRWPWIAFGLGVYALGLIATAPASLIDANLRSQTQGRLGLVEARGTLWSGTGQLELRDANRRNAMAKHITWRMRPAYLLQGQLRYEVGLDHAPKRFAVAILPSRIEIPQAEINLPAAALALAVPKLAPLELTGELTLRVARLGIDRGAPRGNATLQWRAAGSALSPVAPLGDYELHLEGDGSVLRASLRTLQGPLQLAGQGSWSSGRNPEFTGTAQVPPQHQQQLSPLLRLIAIERGAGSFALQLR